MAAPSPVAAETMDGIYRHQRYFYDATRRYYLFGRDDMLARLKPPPGGSVLEIGCGTARNLIQAAHLYPEAEFYGLDVSDEMLKTAHKAISKRGLAGAIKIAHADATTFSMQQLFHVYSVDRIFISYALSMIPDWPKVIARSLPALAPGGELHVVDFGTLDGLPAIARRSMLAWLKHFQVTPRDDLERVVRETARTQGMNAAFHQGRFGYAAHAIVRN